MTDKGTVRPMRDTKQRAAIKKAFAEADRPLGPKEILELASNFVPRLGIATVYRNVKAMVDAGELVPVEIPGQAPRYFPPYDQSRPIFVCTHTNKVFFLDVDTTALKSLPPSEYHVQRHAVIYYGISPEHRAERIAQRAPLLSRDGGDGNGHTAPDRLGGIPTVPSSS